MKRHFCNYEHLGGCADVLNSKVEYWMGDARKRFGRFAYYCAEHTPKAWHLNPTMLARFEPRHPKADLA